MKKSLLTLIMTVAMIATANAEWKIAGDKIRTSWAENIDPQNVLPEYPRPQLERGEIRDILAIGTGAMMSPASIQQGQSIPAIAHLIRLSHEN